MKRKFHPGHPDNILLLKRFHRAFDGWNFPSAHDKELVIAERFTASIAFADRLGVNRMEPLEQRKEEMLEIYRKVGMDSEKSLEKLEQFIEEGWSARRMSRRSNALGHTATAHTAPAPPADVS